MKVNFIHFIQFTICIIFQKMLNKTSLIFILIFAGVFDGKLLKFLVLNFYFLVFITTNLFCNIQYNPLNTIKLLYYY